MSAGLRVGFGRGEITPPAGTRKIGFLREVVGRRALDRLWARAVVWSCGESTAALVVLDTLSVRAGHVAQMRAALAGAWGLAECAVMIAATHTHAGPAVHSVGDVALDREAGDTVLAAVVAAVGDAIARRVPARVARGRVAATGVAENRRVVLRDGTVRTHGSFGDPDALFVEGPVDPELSVLAYRGTGGEPLGLLAGFACHPTDHGQDEVFSSGWPGALVRGVEAAGWPHALFVNGAFGNVTPAPLDGVDRSIDDVGAALAAAALAAELEDGRGDGIATARVTVELPFRDLTPAELDGSARGAQRVIDPAIYERCMPAIVAKAGREGTQRAEVQALRVGDVTLVGIPAELFAELGLELKLRVHPRRIVIVGAANGMVGYVPPPAAFARGGYEVTLGPTSWLGPGAGELLVAAAERAVSATS